jgi:hypothetical protein
MLVSEGAETRFAQTTAPSLRYKPPNFFTQKKCSLDLLVLLCQDKRTKKSSKNTSKNPLLPNACAPRIRMPYLCIVIKKQLLII